MESENRTIFARQSVNGQVTVADNVLFIEVPELSQEGSFICVLGISNLHISTIFLLNAGTVPTV
jgi:hypothetical protein